MSFFRGALVPGVDVCLISIPSPSCELWPPRLGWFIYSYVTSKKWFEIGILATIVVSGVATGVDMQMQQTGAENASDANVFVKVRKRIANKSFVFAFFSVSYD